MTYTLQSVLDSIVANTPGFHPGGPGSIPEMGDESISKNWRFLFISKDKWFVKSAHLSDAWDLYLFQALFPMSRKQIYHKKSVSAALERAETDFSGEICFRDIGNKA